MTPHSSTLAWKIPWIEEPGRLQSMGSLRVGHNWATSLSLFTFMHWRRKWQPTPVCLPGESQGQEPGGLPSMGSHRVGHDWSDLAAAAGDYLGFPGGPVVKKLPANARDMGVIPGLERSPRGQNGNPLQYSCLGNLTDRGTLWATEHGVTKSRTWLSTYAHTQPLHTLLHLGLWPLWAHRETHRRCVPSGQISRRAIITWQASPACCTGTDLKARDSPLHPGAHLPSRNPEGEPSATWFYTHRYQARPVAHSYLVPTLGSVTDWMKMVPAKRVL